VHAHFSEIDEVLKAKGISKVDGVLLDLGISSPQIDEGDRGFSFRFDAHLDMRMDQTKGLTAAEVLKDIEQKELEKILKEYGEEKFARRISTAIIKERDELGSIETTKQLAKIVADHMPKKEIGQDPATRTFQALRIFINRELEELKEVLPKILDRLKTGGIMVVISFHSLEDRIVKQFINDEKNRDTLPSNFPIRSEELPKPRLNIVTKPIRPSDDEVKNNPRSRSGIMRVAERTAY
jgi:16S rRNA (cytosine1402-N4)-methyltransferase